MGRRLLRGTFRVMGIILRYVELFPFRGGTMTGRGDGNIDFGEYSIVDSADQLNAGYLAEHYSRRNGDCDGSEWASGHCWEILSSRKLQWEDSL
jgi:hypothetical protein